MSAPPVKQTFEVYCFDDQQQRCFAHCCNVLYATVETLCMKLLMCRQYDMHVSYFYYLNAFFIQSIFLMSCPEELGQSRLYVLLNGFFTKIKLYNLVVVISFGRPDVLHLVKELDLLTWFMWRVVVQRSCYISAHLLESAIIITTTAAITGMLE